MKYKVKILKQPKYQNGGNMQQQELNPEQIVQGVAAMLQQGTQPEEVAKQLIQMGLPQEQVIEIIQNVMQQLQGEGGQEEMQPDMQQQMGYGEEEDENEEEMPAAAYGGQMGYGLDLGSRRLWMNQDDDEQSMVNRSIKEVPRNEANIEAEGGETALIPNSNDNTYSHFNIQGKRHTNGGVPLNVPEGTFIYSDTKKMKLGGSVLKVFGKSDKTSKKYTPADLAKQYNLNKYTSILESPKASQLEKRTAELMIQNYNKKLAQLALVQESKKGYPQGIPKVAEEYYAKTKEYIESQQTSKLPNNNRMQYGGEGFDPYMKQPQAMYGMGFKYGGSLKRFQGDEEGSEVTKPSWHIDMEKGPVIKEKRNSDAQPIFTPSEEDNDLPIPPSNDNLNYSGPSLTSNKLFTNYKLGMQNTPNYNDPTLSEIDLGMQQNRKYFDPNLLKINYEPKKLNFYKKEDNEDEDYSKYKQGIKYGRSNIDKRNIALALLNKPYIGPRPTKSTAKFQRAETTYLDPARALAAVAEQANARRQANNMFAGKSAMSAKDLPVSTVADIIGQYGNQNVQLGNIAANQATDTNNKQIMYDAEQDRLLRNAESIYGQNLNESQRNYLKGITAAINTADKNAADIYNLNMSESPYYAIDPSTYRMGFHSPKSMRAFYNQKNNNNSNSDYDAMVAAGFDNFNDWSKSLGYASYDQLMKARSSNQRNTRKA
jgi:hypothetical protein